MNPKSPTIPKLGRHKASGRGVVRLSGHDHYVGPWPNHLPDPPPETRAAYDRLTAEWLAGGRRPLRANGSTPGRAEVVTGPSVSEVILRFWHHAERYYCGPDGTPTGELGNYRDSLRPLRRL